MFLSDFYNTNFGKWEQIKKFEITSDEWTIEAGHLTPTMKMKRKIILMGKVAVKQVYKSKKK